MFARSLHAKTATNALCVANMRTARLITCSYTMPCLQRCVPVNHLALAALFSGIMCSQRIQINNVIIASGDDQDY